MSRGRMLAILGIALFIGAGLAVFVLNSVTLATGLFFSAWGVWFAATIWK